MRLPTIFAVLASAVCATAAAAQTLDRRIEAETEINAPIEKVWEAWTTCEGLKTFFARGCNIDLRVDGAYAIYLAPDAPQGSRGADNAHILAIQTNRMLSFTWDAAPPGNPEIRKNRTHVVVRLFPLPDNRTRATLVNDGYGEGEDWDKAFDYLAKAWPNVLGALKRRFEQAG